MLEILRFNWPWYVGAAAVCAATVALVSHVEWSAAFEILLLVGSGLAAYWMLASLVASYWVYDVSKLSELKWLEDALPRAPQCWVNIHAGFDQASHRLRALFPGDESRIFDIFDPGTMSEASIERARKQDLPALEAERVAAANLPAADGEFDAAFLVFAAHELREENDRAQLFREIARSLDKAGRVVVVEHLRDAANFLAFGPGYRHFFDAATWQRALASARLTTEKTFRITPFVRVWVASKSR